MAKFRKLRKREGRKAPATAPRERPRQPVIARPHVLLEPTDPERESDALDEVRGDLAGVPGEGRPWQGSEDR